ncbi:MAG: carbohydrate ABC transporter permease [Anaerolineae bacterium]
MAGETTSTWPQIKLRFRHRETIAFYVLASPWLIGFLALTLGPMLISFAISFMRYEVITPPEFIGLANYRTMFFHDELIWQSLKVTAAYSVGSVLVGMVTAFLVALLMNQQIPGIHVFRTIYYLPSSISGVPVALLWMWIFNPEFGVLNTMLRWFGIRGPQWLFDPHWVISAFVIMSLWGIGGGMVIFLAALQGIPQHLYEAAELDGAGVISRLFHVTIPMISPVILFNLVMSIIGSMQTFTQAFVMTKGGPANASLFYVLYLYQNAIGYFKMGYGSAMAWFLLVIILALSGLVLRSSPLWVYYEGEMRG